MGLRLGSASDDGSRREPQQAAHRRRQQLGEALDHLSAQQRCVLSLAYHPGLTTTHIAASLGVSDVDVKSGLHDAVWVLRTLLQDLE